MVRRYVDNVNMCGYIDVDSGNIVTSPCTDDEAAMNIKTTLTTLWKIGRPAHGRRVW